MPIGLSDIALFLISFVACGYCIVLSRRLKALQDTKDGLGATIVAFNDSMAALSATTGQSRKHVTDLANQLPPLIQQANAACKKVEETTRTLETKDEIIIARVERTHRELDNSMRALLEETRRSVTELTELSARAQKLYVERPSPVTQISPAQTAPRRAANGSAARVVELDHDLF